MKLHKTNFFHHFNTKSNNYSKEEIRFELEIKAEAKVRSLTDVKEVKPPQTRIFESDTLCR